MKFSFLDVVTLASDMPDEELKAGSTGTIIDIYTKPHEAYEVEFCDDSGRTIKTLVLLSNQILPTSKPQMKNPLIKIIEHEFKHFGIYNFRLIRESYNPNCFGNAEVLYELENLRLYFLRDKSQDLLSIAGLKSPEDYYLFCDISLAMGWQTLDEVTNVTEPISLNKALNYIKNNFDLLKDAFSDSKISKTLVKIKNAEKMRILSTDQKY